MQLAAIWRDVTTTSLRRELDRITDAQQLPVLLIMIAFWIVCGVEWLQRLLGTVPDPRFWSLISLVFTFYGGVQIFRLNRGRETVRIPDPRSKAFRVLRQAFSNGSGRFHNPRRIAAGLDNVLVTETGVYAVQIRHRSGSGTIEHGAEGEVIFGGRLRDGRLLQNAARAAQPLQTLLAMQFSNTPVVRPVIVMAGDWTVTQPAQDVSVDVISVHDVPSYFGGRPAAFTPEEIGQISACLDSIAA